MGELLLCNEAIAAMPYYIEGVSINVYSIEELNYYIINNTYLLDDDFMSLELCTWIENHAHLPKLAMHLRTIISTNGRLSAFVTELLEYSGYCTKEELKNTHDALKELEEKSEFECLKIRADRLMEKKSTLQQFLNTKSCCHVRMQSILSVNCTETYIIIWLQPMCSCFCLI